MSHIMTPEEFMAVHGEQVCTALRTTVEFWEDASKNLDDPAVARLAAGQIETWRQILHTCEETLEGGPVVTPGPSAPFITWQNNLRTEDTDPL